jgi:gamma-glutamyl-gamma-aminobutyrate hydrolase PuuD
MNPSDIIPGRKVFIIGGGSAYVNWMQAEIVDRMEDATFVVATGGEDISPERYGARRHPSTYSSRSRDDYEFPLFEKAVRLGKPLVGICRGSQAMCVFAGGKLVQDQPNPYYLHLMETYDGKTIIVSSTHHQAQHPWNLPIADYSVLGWTRNLLSHHWGERDGQEMVVGVAPDDKEVEIVVYRKTRALAIQSHPEGLYHDYEDAADVRESIDYCRSLLDRHLANTL